MGRAQHREVTFTWERRAPHPLATGAAILPDCAVTLLLPVVHSPDLPALPGSLLPLPTPGRLPAFLEASPAQPHKAQKPGATCPLWIKYLLLPRKGSVWMSVLPCRPPPPGKGGDPRSERSTRSSSVCSACSYFLVLKGPTGNKTH